MSTQFGGVYFTAKFRRTKIGGDYGTPNFVGRFCVNGGHIFGGESGDRWWLRSLTDSQQQINTVFAVPRKFC